MNYSCNKYHRRSVRLHDYDYSQPGAYFVTVCTLGRESIFGEIVDGQMVLNQFGTIAQVFWNDLPHHFPHVKLDAFVIMPNHMHGIVALTYPVGAQHAAPLQDLQPPSNVSVRPGSLGAVIRSFKSAVSKCMNEICGTSESAWQRNYYEHIIRSGDELNRVREYIAMNPIQWAWDRHNPNRLLIKGSSEQNRPTFHI